MNKKNDIVKIYDDMFNMIGTEKWSVVHEEGLLHQVVHLWIYSDESDGRWMYFVQRPHDLDVYPGLYDLPVSGHIDPDETFSETLISITEEHLGLKLTKDMLKHVGNIRQKIDVGHYHDNAFCQIYVKKLTLPIPDFDIHDVDLFFKVKYEKFCQWLQNPEGSISLYTPTGEYIKDSVADEWWWLRKNEFTTIVQPYIDKQK